MAGSWHSSGDLPFAPLQLTVFPKRIKNLAGRTPVRAAKRGVGEVDHANPARLVGEHLHFDAGIVATVATTKSIEFRSPEHPEQPSSAGKFVGRLVVVN